MTREFPDYLRLDLLVYFEVLLDMLRLIRGINGPEPLQTEGPWPIPRHMVAHRGREDRGTTSSIASCLELRVRERSKRKETSTLNDFSTTFRFRLGRATKGSDIRVRYGGIRVRGAIPAGAPCIAHTLECTSVTDTSKPANNHYYVLQSRCNVPRLYH